MSSTRGGEKDSQHDNGKIGQPYGYSSIAPMPGLADFLSQQRKIHAATPQQIKAGIQKSGVRSQKSGAGIQKIHFGEVEYSLHIAGGAPNAA
jgi:hypothetical protein